MPPTLCDIRLYPIKSTAGQALREAEVEPRGLRGDRRWMLIDGNGRFVTGRQEPGLTQVRAQWTDRGLSIVADGQPPLEVRTPVSGSREVRIWKDNVNAHDAGDAAAQWFTGLFGRELRLVHMADSHHRPVDPEYSQDGDLVSFADGFPLLLLSSASVDALNQRLKQPVTAAHFRPNLLIDGCTAFAEDDWARIRIGEVEFDVVKPCSRCIFTTVDPDSGQRREDGEPLRSLGQFRRDSGGRILFGQNLVARTYGLVQHGDPVRIIACSGENS